MQATIQRSVPQPVAAPEALVGFDVEAVRVPSERSFASRVAQHPQFAMLASRLIPGDPKEIRRRLMAQSLRLSDSMAPDAYRAARSAQRVLGVAGEIEIFQRSGAENAAIHLVDTPILLEVQGPILSLLDEATLLGVFGHELGHYLAHGPRSPLRAPLSLTSVLGRAELDRPLEESLSRLSMAAELTADRIGLLVCQDLHTMLRLEMVTLTGLSSGALTWDTEAYLAQSRDLMEAELAQGGGFFGRTHPEHNLRSYALWLFSQTTTFRRLTGRGPGTRELAEVDGILARFFGDAEAPASSDLVLDYSRLGEPPRELHECALAAAVIVAHADEEVREDEVSAIERIFAPLVPDWRQYLDFEVALERFHELAPVLAAAGPDLVRSLFQLLVHVMGADDEVDAREVQVILTIGRAMGAETRFRQWLASTLAALKVPLRLDEAAPRDLPLPARRDEVADAFETYLRSVSRRGESETTLRRLLRLVGTDRRTPDAVAKIQSLLAQRSVSSSADLSTAGLDERLKLTTTVRTGELGAARPPRESSGARAMLTSALRRLREQLVSGDGRSPSVRLRQARRGRAFDLMDLERVSVGLAERVVAQVRAGRAVRVIDAASAGRHASSATAAAELLALAREDAGRFEETGAHDLFVGYPFLTGVVDGYAVRAPLVLYPVQIEREGAGAQGFRLRPRQDESAIANQSLIRLIFNKRGFVYSDELSDELEELAGDPDAGPDAVRRRLAEVGLATSHTGGALVALADRDEELAERGAFLEVEECAVLGLFPQSSSDLLQDYDGLLQELTQTNASVVSLLASASVLLPDEVTGTAASAAPPAEAPTAPVIAADPTQRLVISECRKHGATVVDGPPGTGKSQVIVNLVAQALRRGERVAVVCEKRAALDVVRQRLGSLGFEKALAVVHDVQEDRKTLFELISKRIEETEPSPFDASGASRAAAEHASIEQGLDARAAALRARPEGLDLTVGELMTLASGLPATTVAPPPGLERLDQRRLRELIEVSIDLQPFSALWGASSPFRSPQGSAPRRSFASLDGRGVREVAQQLEACLSAASEYEAVAASSPVDPEHVEGARGALAHAIHARAARTEPSDHEVFRSLLPAAAEAPERLASTDAVRAAWESSSAAITKLREPIQLEASGEMVAALSVLRRWSRTWVRFFVIGWWLARFALRRELARAWPDRAGEELTPAFLDDLADRIAASRGWRALAAAFDGLAVRHLLPSSSDALEPTVRRLVRIGPAVRDLAQTRSELRRAAAWPSDFVTPDGDLNRWEQALDARVRLLDVRDALARAAVPVQQAFPWVGVLPSASTLAALLAAWTQAGPRVVEMDALLGRASELLPTAPVLLDALAAAHPSSDAAAWRSATTSAWATAWLVRLERESGLASLGTAADDREVDRAATRLAELEEELREFEIERTLHQVDDAELLRTAVAEKHQRRTPAQKIREELLKETRKKRRLMPLRSFVRRFAPSGLLGVLPVWLLSPETMAILFPRQPLFDLVVFDEASQCTVEAGLPVLLRAKRVVIAGDEKQMPPSSYFALGTGDGDDASPEDESRREIQDILGSESLLTLARTRCAHAGLAWHYRCRHEALIAFSNHALYGGGLLTIPATASRDSRSPLRWVSVADGTYDAGENKREAERVVDVVHELLQRSPRPSIGVITFNLRQRKAVLDAIETRCARDDDFLGRWSEASTHESMDERPFVKNLEQVQGDERDVIVFSLGHAPQERRKKGSGSLERYVPARFGPLGQRGGERRLNVAISRAKSECTVVASFEPQHLTVATSKNEGPKLFKQFLEFAHHMHHGRRLEASRILDLVRDSARARTEQRVRLPIDGYLPLASQLSLALEEARIPHEVDVGASTFRVPVAVLDPRDPARYALAILLDDGTSTSSAFDQHVHRRAVLGTRGWKVISITAASWYRRPASILAEIEAAVPGARGALDSSLYAEHRSGRRRVSAEPPPPPSSPTTKPEAPAAAEAVPPWAAVIEDRLFQRALLHLHRHGSLGEAELTNLVGGPRRARQFARELEGLRERLPFRVEAQDLNGSKVYRVAGAT